MGKIKKSNTFDDFVHGLKRMRKKEYEYGRCDTFKYYYWKIV